MNLNERLLMKNKLFRIVSVSNVFQNTFAEGHKVIFDANSCEFVARFIMDGKLL